MTLTDEQINNIAENVSKVAKTETPAMMAAVYFGILEQFINEEEIRRLRDDIVQCVIHKTNVERE